MSRIHCNERWVRPRDGSGPDNDANGQGDGPYGYGWNDRFYNRPKHAFFEPAGIQVEIRHLKRDIQAKRR
jgi:hypothetical protein